jgi:hypothetical protein
LILIVLSSPSYFRGNSPNVYNATPIRTFLTRAAIERWTIQVPVTGVDPEFERHLALAAKGAGSHLLGRIADQDAAGHAGRR